MASGKALGRVRPLLKAVRFRVSHAMLQFIAAVQHLLQGGPGACSSNVLSICWLCARLLAPRRPATRSPLSSSSASSVMGRGTVWVPITALLMALVFVMCVILAVAPALLSFFHASHQVLNWQCSFYIVAPYFVYVLCQGISTTPAVTQATLHVIYVLCPKATVWHGNAVATQQLPLVNGQMPLSRAGAGVSSMADVCEHSSVEGSRAMHRWSGAGHNIASRVVSCAQHVLFVITWQVMAFVCYGGAVMAELAIFFSWVRLGRLTAASASPYDQQQLPGQQQQQQQQQQHDMALLFDARANARCISAMTALLNNMLMFLIAVFLLFVPLAAGGSKWNYVVGLRASGVAFTALSGAATLSRFLCSCCLSSRLGLRSCSTWVFILCVNLYLLGTVCLQAYCFLGAFSRYGSNGQQVYGFLSAAFHLSVLLLNPDSEAKRMLSAGWTTNKVLLVGCVLTSGFTGVCLDWPALLAAFGLAEGSGTLVRQPMWCMQVLFSPANRVVLLLRLVGQGMFLLSMNHIAGKPPCQGASAGAGQLVYASLAQNISDISSVMPSAESVSEGSYNNKDFAAPTTPTAMDMFLVGCQQCSLPLKLGSTHTIEPGSSVMWLVAGVMAAVVAGSYIASYLVFVYCCACPSSMTRASLVGQTSSSSSRLAGTANNSNQTNMVAAQPPGTQWQRLCNWLQFVAAFVIALVSGLFAAALAHPWVKLGGFAAVPLGLAVLQWVTVPWEEIVAALGLASPHSSSTPLVVMPLHAQHMAWPML